MPAPNQIKKNKLQAKDSLGAISPITTTRADRARELILNLRNAATEITDVQALCAANASAFEELQSLGDDALDACCDEIADKKSPVSLRIVLIEIISSLKGHDDPRLGQLLMAIIGDATDSKPVRMQALQWIPQTGNQSAGISLVQMLPNQTDADLEFGITRALRGFRVPGSVEVLKGGLADDKGHLIRIASSHAIAAQGGREALALLQASAATRSVVVNGEERPEEIAVAVHEVLALGEIPDVGSLPILKSILNNSTNSVHVRSKAAETIATIGGEPAAEILRTALRDESDESVLVYVGRGLGRCGDTNDATQCLQRAASVSDSYTRNELERMAHALQGKRNNE
jgi:HEAT repeat protein